MSSIPAPLPVSYASQARALSTATIHVRSLPGGGVEQRIEHAPLAGVTREMLFWWMHQIGDVVEFEGHRVKAYRLWHPRDHIDWSCDGPVRAGAKFHIVEAFQAKRRFLVDQVFFVPRLDPTGFRIESSSYGIARLSIDEDWQDVPGGVQWTNTMQLTAASPIAAPVVRVMRTLMKPMLSAWLEHNIEEVGFVPYFLPHLYAQAQQSR